MGRKTRCSKRGAPQIRQHSEYRGLQYASQYPKPELHVTCGAETDVARQAGLLLKAVADCMHHYPSI